MFKKFRPLNNKILIKCNTSNETTTSSGIIIKNEEEQAFVTGTVIAIGDKATDVLKIGDTVYFHHLEGSPIDDHVVIKEDLILGVIDK